MRAWEVIGNYVVWVDTVKNIHICHQVGEDWFNLGNCKLLIWDKQLI